MSTTSTNTVIYPEMGEKTKAEITYECSYSNGYYVKTKLELKGRGIKKTGDGTNCINGKFSYRVTELALEKLKTQFDCCYIALLS